MQHMTAVIAGAAGGAVAIALMELLSERAAFPLILVPFATSIVLVMGSPEIEAAQPRPLIGGHVVATVVGLLVVKITGPGVFAAALAVGLAMVAMHLTKSFHPPAGIPSSSCSTTCPGVFSSPRWRSAHACWLPWPSFGTTFSAAVAGPSGGGDPLAANRPSGSFRRGFERGLTQPAELAVALEHEPAAVERGERGAVADRHDRGALEPRIEKAIERGFRRLVERGRRLVEEKIVRCLQNGAGNAEALLLAEREHSVPVRFLREPPDERG